MIPEDPPEAYEDYFVSPIQKVVKSCCEFSRQQLDYYCKQHGYNCPDRVLYTSFSERMGIRQFFLEAKNATYGCVYCPSCGDFLMNSVVIDNDKEDEQELDDAYNHHIPFESLSEKNQKTMMADIDEAMLDAQKDTLKYKGIKSMTDL